MLIKEKCGDFFCKDAITSPLETLAETAQQPVTCSVEWLSLGTIAGTLLCLGRTLRAARHELNHVANWRSGEICGRTLVTPQNKTELQCDGTGRRVVRMATLWTLARLLVSRL